MPENPALPGTPKQISDLVVVPVALAHQVGAVD